MRDYQIWLQGHDACGEGMEWIANYPTLLDAWRAFDRGDWMLWLLRRMGYYDDPKSHLLTCRIVRETPLGDGRTVWDVLSDERSRKGIEAAEAYARGEMTIEKLRTAARAAAAAARAAAAADYAADYADYAAAARAAAAAARAAAAAGKRAAQKWQADTIREMVPESFILDFCRAQGWEIPEVAL